jgi:hypothetical protein
MAGLARGTGYKVDPVTGEPLYDARDPGGSARRNQAWDAEQRAKTEAYNQRIQQANQTQGQVQQQQQQQVKSVNQQTASNTSSTSALDALKRAQELEDRAAAQRREDELYNRDRTAQSIDNTDATTAFDTFMSKYGGDDTSSSSSSSTGATTGGIDSGSQIALDTGAIAAGDAAAYSRAKDQVGQSQQGLQKALANQFSTRGLRGSSMEGRAVGSALEFGAGQLNDVSREQAIGGSQRAVDLAKTQYQGGITQRGQDLSERASARSNATQRQSNRTASVLGLYNAYNNNRQRY